MDLRARHLETCNRAVSLNQLPAGREMKFAATDAQTHTCKMAGTRDLNLTVRDDDCGTVDMSILVIVI